MAFGKTKKLSGPKSHSPADCEQATAFVYLKSRAIVAEFPFT